MAISNTQVTSANTLIYTSSGNTAITTIIFCNTTAYNSENPEANQSLLYVYAVPNVGGIAGTASSSNIIINGLPIPAGETVSLDQEKLVLSLGDTLVAKTDSLSNITATVSSLAV
jgi:hypothetical protein